MTSWLILVGLALAAPPEDAAADSVVLRDGSVALGQVVDSPLKDHLVLWVRRAWAMENLPAWARRWEMAEAPLVAQGRRQRRDRLSAWRREWPDEPDRDNPALAWLDRERIRVTDPRQPKSPLMAVTLARAEVRSVVRRPRPIARLVRLGWLGGLEGVETMTPAALAAALAAAGVAIEGPETVSVEPLLPLFPEPEDRWRARRAATEVLRDPSLRFVRFTRLTLPEPADDEIDEVPPFVLDTPLALAALRSLVDLTDDALRDRFDEAEDRGRVGAVVTEVEIDDDETAVSARATLWVRRERDGWQPTAMRQASERVTPARDGDRDRPDRIDLFQSSLLVLESFAGHPPLGDQTAANLDAGAAARRAMRRARSALDLDLRDVALPMPVVP